MSLQMSDVEAVTEFVQRYCAVETSEGSEPAAGRFVFFQGPKRRGAKSNRKPVAYGELDRCVAEVLRRVREMAANGEGNVWLAAYSEGSTNPDEELRIAGSMDEVQAAEDDQPADGSAVAALVHGNLAVLKLLREENREWRDRAFRGMDAALEDRERSTALAYYVSHIEQGQDDARMQAALTALAPTLQAVMPRMVDMLGRFVQGSGPPPEVPKEPGPRIAEYVRRMLEAATGLGAACTEAPTEATPERVAPLYELVAQLAGPLGLKVRWPKGREPKGPPAAAAGGSDGP